MVYRWVLVSGVIVRAGGGLIMGAGRLGRTLRALSLTRIQVVRLTVISTERATAKLDASGPLQVSTAHCTRMFRAAQRGNCGHVGRTRRALFGEHFACLSSGNGPVGDH